MTKKRNRPNKYNVIPTLQLTIDLTKRGLLSAPIIADFVDYFHKGDCEEPTHLRRLDLASILTNRALDLDVSFTHVSFVPSLNVLIRFATTIARTKGAAYLLWINSRAYLSETDRNIENCGKIDHAHLMWTNAVIAGENDGLNGEILHNASFRAQIECLASREFQVDISNPWHDSRCLATIWPKD